jgi:hypothetical protein
MSQNGHVDGSFDDSAAPAMDTHVIGTADFAAGYADDRWMLVR